MSNQPATCPAVCKQNPLIGALLAAPTLGLAAVIALVATTTSPLLASAQVTSAPNVLAFTNATIIDGTGTARSSGQTIVVENGRITAVGPTASTTVPAAAKTRDLAGKVVTPGFVMMHEHLFYPIGTDQSDLSKFMFSSTAITFPSMYLAGGVTTMRTAGTMSPFADLNVGAAIANGKLVGPDMDTTAPYVDGPQAVFTQMRATPSVQDVPRFVDFWSQEGMTSYKAYMNIQPAQLAALVQEAGKRKQKVTGHLCATTYSEAANAGIHNLEHGFWAATDFVAGKVPNKCPEPRAAFMSLATTKDDDPKLTALIDLLVSKRVAITSTNAVFESIINQLGSGYTPAPGLAFLPPGLRERVLADYSAPVALITPEVQTQNKALFAKVVGWEKKFHDAGGTLLLGTDPTGNGTILPGFGTHRAMEILAGTGIPIEQVIKIATFNGAQFLGREKDIGSIKVGKRADLVVFSTKLDKPDQFRMTNVDTVVKAGVVHDPKALLASVSGRVGLH